MISDGWLTEGVSTRSPITPKPNKHILVIVNSKLELWCTGSTGREDPGTYPAEKLCRGCRELARDAVDKDMLDPQSARKWLDDDTYQRALAREAED